MMLCYSSTVSVFEGAKFGSYVGNPPAGTWDYFSEEIRRNLQSIVFNRSLPYWIALSLSLSLYHTSLYHTSRSLSQLLSLSTALNSSCSVFLVPPSPPCVVGYYLATSSSRVASSSSSLLKLESLFFCPGQAKQAGFRLTSCRHR